MTNYLMIGLTLAGLCAASSFAEARPPTVMNSPGYDARLQESRKALSDPATTPEPAPQPATKPKPRKKKQTH